MLGDGDEELALEERPIVPGTARAALRYPAFRRVLFGAFLSNIGTWMHNVVLGAIAYDLTKSSAFVGLVVFAQLGPLLLLSPLGGVIADRFDRRRVLTVATISQFFLSLLLAAVMIPDEPSKAALLAVTFCIGIGQAIYAPCFNALLPELVEGKDIAGAVSLNSAQMNTARVIGPVIGSFLYAVVGAPAVFATNGVSYLFVVAAVAGATLPKVGRTHHDSRGFRALGDGLRIARAMPVVWRCLVTIAVFSLVSLPFVGQFPTLASRNLDMEVKSTSYGVLYACFGIGAVFGALSVGTVFSRHAKETITRYGLVAFAVSVSVLSLLRAPAPAYPVVLVVGFTYIALVTSLMTRMQEELDNRVRGRVMALWIMGWGGTVPIGNLLAGPIIDATSVTTVMLFGAAAALALSWYVRSGQIAHAEAEARAERDVRRATIAATGR